MTVAAVLKQKGNAIIAVAPDATIQDVADLITSRRIGAVLVTGPDQRMIGIVSERDVVKAIALHRAGALAMTAAQLMTRDPITASPETTVDEAMQMMDRGYFRHLPVVENDRLIGIISVRDLVRYRLMQQKADLENLTSYVFRIGS